MLRGFPCRKALNESLLHAPLVLLQEHSAQLCQRVRADIVERPEDALTVFDGECDDLALERERLLERGARRLVHELDELAYVLVGNPQDRRDTRRLNLPSRTVGETALVQAAAELEAAERRGNRPNRVLSGGAKAGHDRERWRGNALASPSIPIHWSVARIQARRALLTKPEPA